MNEYIDTSISHISVSMPVLKESKGSSEWKSTIKMFQDEMPSLKPSFIALRISPFKEDRTAIHILFNQCKHARNFTSLFIYKTK